MSAILLRSDAVLLIVLLVAAMEPPPAVACAVAAPFRGVHGGTFISTGDPPLCLSVARRLRYLGSFHFNLGSVARVERYVFADSAGGRVRRMLILQFEGILPSSDEIYRYPIRTPAALAGVDYQHDVFFDSVEKDIAEAPGAETAHTVAFLRGKGLHLDDEQMLSRFARPVGPDRKHELIFFYQEPVRTTGHALAEVSRDGRALPEFRALAEALDVRARAAFALRASQ